MPYKVEMDALLPPGHRSDEKQMHVLFFQNPGMAVDARLAFEQIILQGEHVLTTDVVLDRRNGDITGDYRGGYTPVYIATMEGRLVGVRTAHSSWVGFNPHAEADA